MFYGLKKLVDADSISGYEEKIQDVLKQMLKNHVDEIKTDKIGNVIGKKGKGSPTIMFAAHMDEIGLIVKYIDKNGFIFFDKIGGWDERILPAKKVLVHGSKGPVIGVIGSKPPHLQDKEESKKPVKLKDMFIDIGAGSEDDVKKAGISVGDFISRQGSTEKMLGKMVTGRGFDNRIGCLVMTEIAKRLRTFRGTVYFVGTVKEEIGLIGVRSSAFSVNPDVLIALDTSIAGDVPGISKPEVPLTVSDGPALDIKDAMSIIHPQVKKWVKETAEKNKINLQFDVLSGGATDASVTPTIREGIPSGALNVPVRYIHTTIEVADMKTIENTVKLCVKMVENAHIYF